MSLFFYRFAALLALVLSCGAQAGIIINTTRVIYPAEDKEVSFGVHNTGSGEILVQSWLEPSAEHSDASNLPFVITPALARLSGDGRQLLRVIYAGHDMPRDRESVLWLNVQEIPQAVAENALQVAIRQRIKLFFRPQGLVGDVADAPEKLRWTLAGDNTVQVDNPGPYHVSMVRIAGQRGSAQLLNQDSQMIAPGQSLKFALASAVDSAGLNLSFISINDFGGQVAYQATLKTGTVAQAGRTEPR